MINGRVLIARIVTLGHSDSIILLKCTLLYGYPRNESKALGQPATKGQVS